MSQPSGDCEVVIVGAGPTGLVLALELARRGVRARLVDQAQGPMAVGRAVGLQARTLEIFENQGLLQLLLGLGEPVVAAHIYQDKKLLRTTLSDGPVPEGVPYPLFLALEQGLVERILASQLARYQVNPEWGTAFTGLHQDERGVYVELAGKTLRCQYLVACDGARSAVRQALQIDFPGKGYPFRWMTGDVAVDWQLPYNQSYQFWQGSLCLGVMPILKPNRFRMWTREAEAPPAGQGIAHGFVEEGDPPRLEDFQALAERLVPGQVRVHSPRLLGRYRVDCRLASHYRKGRCFLAGDAAHVHAPSTYQGMNTGIQDAFNLGWKLARSLRCGSPPRLLDSYEVERRPVARQVLEEAEKALESPPEATPARVVHGHFFSGWWQLELNYRTSHEDRIGNSKVRAGDRAPDGTLVSGEERLRLFEQMRSGEYVVLAFLDSEQDGQELFDRLGGCQVFTVGPYGEFQDPGDRLRRLYCVPNQGGLVLIRPDGYIASRSPLEEPEWLLTRRW